MATKTFSNLDKPVQLVSIVGDNGDGTSSNSSTVFLPPASVQGGTFNRPADTVAYAAGDLIANSVTAGSVVPITIAAARVADRPFRGRRLRLKVTNPTGWKGIVVRAHLFRNSPVVMVGDNGVFNTAESYACAEADYIGYQDITLTQAFSDYAKGFAVGVDFISTPSPGTVNIFALLEARSAVTTPGSGTTFMLNLEVLRD